MTEIFNGVDKKLLEEYELLKIMPVSNAFSANGDPVIPETASGGKYLLAFMFTKFGTTPTNANDALTIATDEYSITSFQVPR